MKKKSNKMLSQMAQITADKIRNFYEDSLRNSEVSRLVDYIKLLDTIKHLEKISEDSSI